MSKREEMKLQAAMAGQDWHKAAVPVQLNTALTLLSGACSHGYCHMVVGRTQVALRFTPVGATYPLAVVVTGAQGLACAEVARSHWLQKLDVETAAGVLVKARRAMPLPMAKELVG